MNIRSNSMMALACLAMATLSAPAAADGEPASRNAGHPASPRHAAPMTAAPQKPGGAGVKLEYRLDGAPKLGQATPVVLQFEGVTEAEGATVRLSADKGLALQGSSTLVLPAGKRTTATVLVVSETEGLAYLNVFIKQGGASSVVSVPIQTGTAAPTLKSSGEMKTTPGGDSIITMPVK
ncbi:hypothetical protein FB547_101642 [Variovorax beijingensis]|uniref:Uncharacterized protein n=2 Tax=Variovorax TaxID=34072 RepID=A0AAE3XZI0_VARPD|nr:MULTISPECIES: hypothetical protein [Variovorax]MBD9668539.1 hypothetical protein [Variovorax sp. VRV01]MDP9966581.1 hypothetical protein [Variovorax paradoxus]MDR6426608.1 hypothetical protein [Variovorax paradoxus]MDR6450538.1 hypothetical protein [Variovorax paradoxus]TWD90973.1 hypothetical protein FB547_101642 [Variovorax beijingensis]